MLPSAATVSEAHAAHERARQQRREQQQEVHEGGDEWKQSDGPREEPDAAAHAALSVAQRCHRDGLHSVFSFLALPDLLPALRSCRWWRDAAYTERPRALEVSLDSAHWRTLVCSPLRRHVREIIAGPDCSLNDLALLRQCMPPSLRALDVWISGPALAACAQRAQEWAAPAALSCPFPPSLTQLSAWIDVSGSACTPSALQQLLDLACTCASLRRLSLDLAGTDEQLDLSPLLRLSDSLTYLRIRELLPTDAMLGVIKQLPRLTCLVLLEERQWSPQQLRRLCAPPHIPHMQLRDVALYHTDVNAEHIRALALLPSLRCLKPRSLSLDALPLLPSLLGLEELHLQLSGAPSPTPATLFLPAPCACLSLTRLQLSNVLMSDADAEAMAAGLPHLASLTLTGCELPDLGVLAKASRLHTLELHSDLLRAAHLLPLAGVPTLRSLRTSRMRIAASEVDQLLPQLPQISSVFIDHRRVR